MTWRSIAVYYSLAAILGGYLWAAREVRQPLGETDGAVVMPIVTTLASRVDGMVVEGRGLRVVLGRDGDGRWQVAGPADLRVTSDLIDALLDTLTTISPIEILAAAEDQRAEFGLAPAEVNVRLTSEAKPVAELGIGTRNPTRTAVYASRAGTDGVYLLGLNARYYIELILDEISRQLPGAQS